MHTLSSFSICGFFLFAFAHSEFAAASFFRFSAPTTGFVNYLQPEQNEIFFLSDRGASYWLRQGQLKASGQYQVAERCRSLTQNTVAMSTGEGGLTLAFPFLVGVDRVCRIDENNRRISLVAELSSRLPKNTFAASFAGRKDQLYYFLINGREFPTAQSGYVQLLTLSLTSEEVKVQPLLNDVPDFSGALLYDQDKIWINTFPGKIYQLSTAKIQRLIDRSQSAAFLTVAQLETGTTAELNGYMLKGQNYFLFYNEGYQSYLIHHATRTQTNIDLNCEPLLNFSPAGSNQWFALCNRHELKLQSYR
jgi:hypothetical protein